MKRYLADILTLTRFLLTFYLVFLIATGGSVGLALIIFGLAELTDAFDGTCSRKWPFPKNKTPKYRKYAEKYDMIADVLLIVVIMAFVIFRVNMWFGLTILAVLGVSCCVIELIAYGKFFGHPNDCRPGSLYAKNPKKAEKLLLWRRKWLYIPSLAVLVIAMIVASEWDWPIKIAIFAVALVIGIFLWSFLKVRRKKVARD